MQTVTTITNEEAEAIMIALEYYIQRHDPLEEYTQIMHKMHRVVRDSSTIHLLDDGDEVYQTEGA
jgi:hypothetical protein